MVGAVCRSNVNVEEEEANMSACCEGFMESKYIEVLCAPKEAWAAMGNVAESACYRKASRRQETRAFPNTQYQMVVSASLRPLFEFIILIDACVARNIPSLLFLRCLSGKLRTWLSVFAPVAFQL